MQVSHLGVEHLGALKQATLFPSYIKAMYVGPTSPANVPIYTRLALSVVGYKFVWIPANLLT